MKAACINLQISATGLENAMAATKSAKAFISCEYMHAMGNSCGGLSEFTGLESYDHYGGRVCLGLLTRARSSLPDAVQNG